MTKKHNHAIFISIELKKIIMTNHEFPIPAEPDFTLASGVPQEVNVFPSDAEHGAVYLTPPTVARESEAWHQLPVESKIGQLDRRIALLTDVGKIARGHMNSLQEEANTDTLTGLKNRRAFMRSMEERIRKDQGDVAVSFIDLDRFKQVNDTLGHAGGDKLLKAVADRLQREVHLRQGDEIFRFGGDEFLIIYGIETKGNGRRQKLAEAEAIKGFESRIVQEVEVAAHDSDVPYVSASISTLRRRKNETAESLLERTDKAMYANKQTRKSVR